MLKLINTIKPFALYLLIATAVFIFTMSSIPSIPTLKIKAGSTFIRLDYFIHFCEYGFLTFMAFLTFAGKEYEISSGKSVVVFLGLLLFAFADEFHQKIVPGRTYNIVDFISNSAGIAGGWVFSVVVFRKVRRS
jgi:VanZ family protein